MKLLFTSDWLRRKIASAPDDEECEAGVLHPEAPQQRRVSMSWSVSAVGKAPAVAEKIATGTNHKCSEPEETIKNAVAAAIATALTAFPADGVVRVEASGSQQTDTATGKAVNSLKVNVEPVWGFVE